MGRNALGAALGAVLGIAAAVLALASPFLDWYGDRNGRDYELTNLFMDDGITADSAPLFGGLFLPMLIAAVLAVLAVPLRSASLMAAAGVIILGFTILWFVRQYQVADALVIGAGGLGEGAGCALVAGTLGIVAAAAMFGRGRGRHRRVEGGAARGDRQGEIVEGPWRRDEEPGPGREAA